MTASRSVQLRLAHSGSSRPCSSSSNNTRKLSFTYTLGADYASLGLPCCQAWPANGLFTQLQATSTQLQGSMPTDNDIQSQHCLISQVREKKVITNRTTNNNSNLPQQQLQLVTTDVSVFVTASHHRTL
jgi:hypothetical protein